MDAKTLKYYDSQAVDAATRYRAVEGGVSIWFDESFSGYAKLLDIGCGAGRDLCRLLEKGHDAIGADASRAMLAAAAETCRLQGIELRREHYRRAGHPFFRGAPDPER